MFYFVEHARENVRAHLWRIMADDKDFQMKIQCIGQLVGDLENILDPEARASAKTLV